MHSYAITHNHPSAVAQKGKADEKDCALNSEFRSRRGGGSGWVMVSNEESCGLRKVKR